ncbi:AMP-binding protein [Sphingopyxis sp. QXT-31]|uniref:AMP-binding protein n=1 Tax=Sphingopyxis sp. QXT-31 TaxID=1357916 RepID=UPI0012EC880C|nr:AMP-binding protein [Sphingopyxis sp. QXT-31]
MRIITDDRAIDGADLAARVDAAAGAFAARGVGSGDCVALLLRNDIAFLEASLACRRLGAYCVPVNWHFAPDEILYVLGDCGARLLVAHADLLASVADALPCPAIAVPVPPAIAAAYRTAGPVAAGEDWDAILAAATPWTKPSPPAAESLIYTSGTSGHPKGVKRRPAIAEQAAASDAMRTLIYGIGPGSRVLVPAPLYHTAPNLFAHRAAALADLLVLPARFDPAGLLAAIERHRITHLYAVPAMFTRLLALPEAQRHAHDLLSLQFVLHAGGPCAPAVKAAMIDWLGPVIEEYYGSTEAGPITHVSSAEWSTHPGTVGRAIPGVEIAIVDDAGQRLPAGEIGEVQSRNPGYPDFTYLGRDADRAALDRGGLLASGDLGYLDGEGRLFLCDRKRDLVISGGVNIYPAEIEAALQTIAGVADCAVFGIPDAITGEALMAVVEPEAGATLTVEAIREGLKPRLAGYKIPKRIELTAALPREATGKIRKRLLRDPHWAAAGRSI